MSEFANKIDRLLERLHRGMMQCDGIEQRACLTEERLFKLNESVQTLARLIEISCLFLISSEKEKMVWLQLTNDGSILLTNTIVEEFLDRLQWYLKREINDVNEKQAYIQALFLLQSPLIVSSRFLN